jgi:hypothetical protein
MEEEYRKLIHEFPNNNTRDPRLFRELGFAAPEMAARQIVQVKNLPYYDKQGNKVMD